MLSLGCARNLVDAEVILGTLRRAGFGIVDEISRADIAIINTCCFIRDAQEESIEAILAASRLKKEGVIRKLVICGCMVQRYQQKLMAELPEVDAFVDVANIDKMAAVVRKIARQDERVGEFGPVKFLYSHTSPRVSLTPDHFAYVKISEGCSHTCSYCIIPRVRGKYRSRPMSSILQEVDQLFTRRKLSEINIIGQDTTSYGRDRYKTSKIAPLLAAIARRAGERWVRLLYAHPAGFPEELIPVIKNEPALCKYIDLPIQHIDDTILKAMRRATTRAQILALIEKLRKRIPEVALRTTLIVGFPGETEKQFRALLDFIREMKFERLGLFTYSQEEDTPAYSFAQQVPEKEKQRRFRQALTLQQEISRAYSLGFLGKELTVLIDEKDAQDKHLFIGRTQYDAPEVDGVAYVRTPKNLAPGDFVKVKVVDTWEYDLVAEAI